MKKTIKILNIAMIVAVLLFVIANVVMAAVTPANITGNVEVSSKEILDLGNKIVTFIRIVGTIISVGILVVLGIKYMMASPEGKADYKSNMLPYVVGAGLVFASTWIATAVYQMVSSLGNSSASAS